MGALLLLTLLVPALGLNPLRAKEGGEGFREEFEDLVALESAMQEVPEDKVSDPVCLTPGCVKAAAKLLETMDPTKDPCNDFYEFACGKFLEETVIPDHDTSTGSFNLLRDKLNERLRKLFEGKKKTEEPEIFQSVRNLYSSCMDQDGIEKSARGSLLELVEELGGWPVLQGEQWTGDNFVWQKVSEAANRKGLSTGKIVSFGISTNDNESTKRIFEIDQPSLGLEREYLIKGFEDKDVQAYFRYMVETAVFLGANETEAKEQLKAALLFELDLAKINLPKEERRNKTALNNQMTIAEASKLYPGYDWVDHINNMLDSKDVTVDENEVINVATPTVFNKIGEHMKGANNRVVANYLIWRYVKSLMSYQGKEANEIVLRYSKVLTGKETEPPRWETCVKSTSGNDGTYLYFLEGSLTNAVGSMYAKEYFPEDMKKVADEVVENIRKEFIIMLDEITWMDSTTKALAHKKVNQMTAHIAYSKEILDNKLINEFYQGLKLDSGSYMENILTLRKFVSEYYVKEFRQPIDKQSWKTHGGAAVVNAFYNPAENSIQFPAGILDGVFFQSDRPSYLNYGGIGMVVGHEITHGFDDQGSQKDGEGNLVDWWEPATKELYEEKARCIIEQYGNFTVEVDGETLNVNGINTQGENIADNGGFKEALRAYERLTVQHGPEPRLPGLPYTPRQLFWMSGAAVWCSVMRPETMKNRVLTDPHAPASFRVNGPFRNSEEFSKDWNCPRGSPMNPEHKCSVW